MKIKLVVAAASLLLSGAAFAGLQTAPGPASGLSGSIITTPSLAKAIARAEASTDAGRVSVITVSAASIASLQALANNPPAGATVTTGGDIVTILNVTMDLNGEKALVDISYNIATKQVTITRRG